MKDDLINSMLIVGFIFLVVAFIALLVMIIKDYKKGEITNWKDYILELVGMKFWIYIDCAKAWSIYFSNLDSRKKHGLLREGKNFMKGISWNR